MTILAALTFAATFVMPAPDPLGYPLPDLPIRLLGYLTLALHLTAVQFTLGAAFLYVWNRARGVPGHDRCTRFLGAALPLGVSYLITFGIPPLLFVQVIYGQQFYSSSVLMGLVWMHVIACLILAYLGFYVHKLTRDKHPKLQPYLIGVCLILLLCVGLIYVNNLTLSMSPQKWLALYSLRPGGTVFFHGDDTVLPRLFIVISPSLCVAGLALLFWGQSAAAQTDRQSVNFSRQLGKQSFLWGALLTALSMLVLQRRLPRVMVQTMAESLPGQMLMALAVLGFLAALVCVVLTGGGKKYFTPCAAAAWLLAYGSIIALRGQLRDLYLQPYFSPAAVPVHAQWGMFFFFIGLLLFGLTLLAALAFNPSSRAAGNAAAATRKTSA